MVRNCLSEARLWDFSNKIWTLWLRQLWPSRERLMTQRASRMRVSEERGRRTIVLLAQERSRGLLLYEGFRGRVVTPRATTPKVKAKINHPNMGGTLGLLAS